QRAVFTTLPRPAASTWVAIDPSPPPPPGTLPLVAPGPPPVLDTAPQLPSVGGPCPPADSFERRVHADLLEVAILFPVVYQSLTAPVPGGALGTGIVRLPTASLGIAAPFIGHIQFDAWRYGELDLSYKLLAAEGNAV